MNLKLVYCNNNEIFKAIDVMCQSGEWDEWKQNYLEHNWKEVASTFKGIIKSKGKLGIILLLKDGLKTVGVLPLVRIGKKSLLFGCSGVLEKYVFQGDMLLDKELFAKIPKNYQTLLAYARPTSLQWVPLPFRKKTIKNMEDLLTVWHTFPVFFRKSINIVGPFSYCELLLQKIEEKNGQGKNIEKIEDYRSLPHLMFEIFDLNENYQQITNLYKEYNLCLLRQIISFPECIAVCFSGSRGLSGSGYTDSSLIFLSEKKIALDKVFKRLAIFYKAENKKRAFVLFPSNISSNSQDIFPIKSLYQIIYDVPSNRNWRKQYLTF